MEQTALYSRKDLEMLLALCFTLLQEKCMQLKMAGTGLVKMLLLMKLILLKKAKITDDQSATEKIFTTQTLIRMFMCVIPAWNHLQFQALWICRHIQLLLDSHFTTAIHFQKNTLENYLPLSTAHGTGTFRQDIKL